MTITTFNKKGYLMIKHISKEQAIDMRLDWANNFLTVSAFAQYYNISYYSAKRIINL